MKGNANYTDVFVDIVNKIDQVIDSVKNHYKPSGLIYIICESGTKNNLDGFIAFCAVRSKFTIIQVEHDGRMPLRDIADAGDEAALAEAFAHRIGKAMRFNSTYTKKEDEAKVLSPMSTYTFPANSGGTRNRGNRGGAQRGRGGRGRGRGGRGGYRGGQ